MGVAATAPTGAIATETSRDQLRAQITFPVRTDTDDPVMCFVAVQRAHDLASACVLDHPGARFTASLFMSLRSMQTVEPYWQAIDFDRIAISNMGDSADDPSKFTGICWCSSRQDEDKDEAEKTHKLIFTVGDAESTKF